MKQQIIGMPQVVDPTPFCSFDKIEREGIVTLRPMKPNIHKNESLTITGFKGKLYSVQGDSDPEVRNQRYWFGIQIGVNANGTPKFKKINIVDGRMYFLNNPEDAIEWHIMRHHFTVEGSVNLSGRPRWKVEEQSVEAKKSLKKADSFVNVYNFIMNMTDNKLKDFCRLFDMNPNNNTPQIIRGTLVNYAMENPDKFLDYMYDTEKTNIYEVLERSIASNDVQYLGNERGYVFAGISIGLSKQLAIEYLRKNKDMLITLDSSSKSFMSKDEVANKKAVEKSALVVKKSPGITFDLKPEPEVSSDPLEGF